MTLASTETLEMDTKIQYFCIIVHVEALHKFDLLYADVENTENLSLDYYIKGLVLYFTPLYSNSKKKCAMCRGMKKHAV